jgi:tetratricopeptide (TPR) repeat protein
MLTLFLLLLLGAPQVRAQADDAFRNGLLALHQKRLDVALEQLTVAEKERPGDARVRNFRGIVLAQLGRAEEAIAEYRQAMHLDPRMPDPCRNLGYLEWTQHHPEAAREALLAALRLSPGDAYARYYLGRVELDEGHYSEGILQLERARVAWPEEPDFLLQVATGYLHLKRESDTRPLLEQIGRLQLNDVQAVRFGALLLSAREREKALALFGRLDKEHSNARWAQFNLALAHLLAGQPAKAVAEAQALTTRQGLATAWTIIGIARAQLKEHDNAVEAFQKAAERAPNQEERWLDLTRELMEQQHYVDAAASAQQGLQHNPTSYALRLRLGAAYMKSGRYKEAEEVFRDLIMKGDPLPTSSIGLAQALLREARSDEAAAVLEDAQKRLGTSFLLVYFQGIALDRAGRPQEAIPKFQQAVLLNPQNAEAHQWLGKAELRARQVEPAIAELKEALRLDPNNQPARRLLVQAYAMQQQPQEAADYLRQMEIERGDVPKTGGEEAADFFFPTWEMPPATQ